MNQTTYALCLVQKYLLFILCPPALDRIRQCGGYEHHIRAMYDVPCGPVSQIKT